MKKMYGVLLLLILGIAMYSCSTTCGVPLKDAQGKPTVIQYPDK